MLIEYKMKQNNFARLIQISLLFAVICLFWFSTPYVNAGISLCTEAPCDDGESTCLNTGHVV